jgi:hypothetical protein
LNIQNLISAIRKAKKVRSLNNFHRIPRSGIDVKNEEFNGVLLGLKDMLKQFKTENCDIDISFYGEIFITINESGHRFELSIANRPNIKNSKELLKRLETNKFIKLDNDYFNNSLTISIRTIRKRSEWKHFQAPENNYDWSILAETILKEVKARVRYYNNDDYSHFSINDSSKEDKIAAIHLGAALLGQSSMLYHVSKSLRKMVYIESLSITKNCIVIKKSDTWKESNHCFGKKEDAVFDKYLSEYAAGND